MLLGKVGAFGLYKISAAKKTKNSLAVHIAPVSADNAHPCQLLYDVKCLIMMRWKNTTKCCNWRAIVKSYWSIYLFS